MKAFKALMIFLCSYSLLPAQELLPLNSAVQIAMRENQSIEIAKADTRIADVQENWGTAGLLPTISANGSYTYGVVDVSQQLAGSRDTTGVSAPTQINDATSESWNAGLTLNYVLFDGLGRINNLKSLQLQKDLSETQLRFSIENTLLQVFTAYYNSALLLQQLKVDQEAIGLSLRRYERAKAASDLGSGNRLDMLNARVDLNSDSVVFLNTMRDYEKSIRELNLLLHFPTDTNIIVDTNVTLNRAMDYQLLQSQAMENNAALIQAQFNRQIVKKNIAIVQSDYTPEIAANFGYNYSRQDNEGSFLQFSQQQGWQAGLTLRWNLFNGYRTATQVEIAKIQLEQSEIELELASDQLKVDLANAWIDYRTFIKILDTEQRNLAVAQLNFDRSEQSYSLGQINSSQLREAQLNYIQTKLLISDLTYAVRLSEIELSRIAGQLIQ